MNFTGTWLIIITPFSIVTSRMPIFFCTCSIVFRGRLSVDVQRVEIRMLGRPEAGF